MWLWPLFIVSIISVAAGVEEILSVVDTKVPSLRFASDLPAKLSFANSTGKKIECMVEGASSRVNVSWVFVDGNPVGSVPGLREVNGGQMEFLPFQAEKFRPDVHSTVYRCVAFNSIGSIRSIDMHVHAVVVQNYDAQVYDVYAMEGNVAVLKCHIPPIMADHIKTVAWIKNNNLLIRPSNGGDDKYAVIEPGFLHVRDVNISESGSNYKCKTENILTGETRISPVGGHIFVTESQGNVLPKITSTLFSFQVVKGEKLVIPCVGQGKPAPNLRWYQKSSNGELLEVRDKNRIQQSRSSLIIQAAEMSDSGVYVCELSNTNGRSQQDFNVNVLDKLVMNIVSSVQVAKMGEKVTFRCEIQGKHDLSISWLHDGAPIVASEKDLTITASASAQGYYQCIVKSDRFIAQSTAELRLSEIAPYFDETFQEINLQPGDPLNLKCLASGIPLPTIYWKLEETTLNSSQRFQIFSNIDKRGRVESILKVQKLLINDGGVYSCIASNKAGEAQHFSRVNIKGPLGAKKFVKVVAVAGKNAYINCPVYGSPIEKTVWTEGDNTTLDFKSQYQIFPNGTLWIKDVHRPTNNGKYFCTVKNSLQQVATSSVEVEVVVPPKLVPFEFQDELLREGMRARLQCVVNEGDTPINVTWLKDEKPLSNDAGVIVRVLDEFSSILTINSILPKHNGKYTCVASNRAATAVHSAVLSVNVPPKIVPFTFQEDQLIEGQLARVSCIISRGDLPLNLHWEKDGVIIDSKKTGISIRSFDEHSSILSITDVSKTNNGVYTCYAKNNAGSASYSANLSVNVPPRWINEPKGRVSLLSGAKVIVDCQADGYPKPTVEWTFSKSVDQTRNLITHDGNREVANNGSLIINQVFQENEGYYLCKTSNGVGRPLEAVVDIRINAPPYFEPGLQDMKVSLGKNVQWQCVIHGDKPMEIKWLKQGKPLQQLSDNRVTLQTINDTSEIVSSLTIHKVTRDDSGQYQCVAKNSYGFNTSTSILTVIEPPEAPTEVKVLSKSSTNVELEWQTKFNGNDGIKKHIIQYKSEAASWNDAISMETVNGEPTNSIIAHLQPATTYNFRIYAENSLGRSYASPILTATTDEDVPGGMPLDVQVESINAETFKVEWQAPEEKLWNGKILGFSVGFKNVESEEPFSFKTLLTPDPRAKPLSVVVAGLKQFTKYSVVVQAYTSKGKGPLSEPVIVMTSEGAPTSPPTDVRCTTLTSQSIHLTWSEPSAESINGILRGYKVLYKAVTESFDDDIEHQNTTLSPSMTLTKLGKFTNYSIEVMAMTRSADGPKSLAINCKTLDDVPDAPSEFKTAAASESSVIVSWAPPEKANGIIRSYKVYWREAGSSNMPSSISISPRTFNYEVRMLRKGIYYEFWVTSLNIAGESSPSRRLKQNTASPSIPAKIISFGKKITIGWRQDMTLECIAVGSPQAKRIWTINGRLIEGHEKLLVKSDGSLEVKNVQESDGGDYVCTAANEMSEDKITYSVTVLAPPAAPAVDIGTISFNSIEISWKNPSTKLTKVRGYIAQLRKENGDWKEISLAADMSSNKFEGLECGTRYEIILSAFNRVGIGAPSDILIVSTNGSVPAPPVKSDLIEEATNSISLYLNTWKSNGCPIRYYKVEYAPRSSNEWTIISDDVKPVQRRLVVPNLKSGTWYGLRMTAHNSAGSYVAEYTFATLTNIGATISPDFQADSASEDFDGLISYLNFYLIVPIICTVIVLLAILGAACFYIKMKKRELNRSRDLENQMSVAGTLRPGARSGSFSYMQRRNLSSNERPQITEDELAPYATFQLTNNSIDTVGRRGKIGVPLPPPPRFDGFQGSGIQDIAPSVSMVQNSGPIETTFFFPHLQSDETVQLPPAMQFPASYPPQDKNLLFN